MRRAASSGGGPTRAARVVPLEVDLDPESAEFYDYTTADWCREPERAGAADAAGPYVDFICTREYAFTLAAPIRCGGAIHRRRGGGHPGHAGRATGAARAVLGWAWRLGCTAGVLASAHGRVIASTSASLPPGAALPGGPGPRDSSSLAGPGPGAARGPAAVDAARRSHRVIRDRDVIRALRHDQRRVFPVKSQPAG